MEEEVIMLSFPVGYQYEDGFHMVHNTEETKKFLDIPIVVSAESKEEAIKNYWLIVCCHIDFLENMWRRHNKWALFHKGQWNGIGTHWFVVFGFHFYFRRGKKMKGGVYIPFTKLNIRINNNWRIPNKIRKNEDTFGSAAH